jgi:hypothetical protein
LQIKKLQAEGIVTAESYDAAKGSPHLEIFNRQKREINRKLSEGLITDRTAKIQMNKAIADEKMRLIIENQRKEKKKPAKAKKKPAKAKKKPAPAVKKYDPKLFDRQKREINRKLSEELITERTAVIQMNRAIADEKMRLIIENQRKENVKKRKEKKVKSKTEPKKPASTSTKEFEYVEKLKEIKSLREEGAITQAEFKKLKEKIIDSI